tara:strand:- start:9859 stop:10551 length:693 start_codon:yes stop_codon:yes gene_type:complete
MQIYHLDPRTGTYLGAGTAEVDPLELKLAKDAAFNPLAAAANAALAAAQEAAQRAYNQATRDPQTSDRKMASAAKARDRALAAADKAHQTGMNRATSAADAVRPTQWLIPAHAVTDEPPAVEAGQEAWWAGESWSVRPIAPEPPPADLDVDVVQIADSVRRDRDTRIGKVRYLIDRHRDELALQVATTLSPADYAALLQYVQDLRDVPAQGGFPLLIDWPKLPTLSASAS